MPYLDRSEELNVTDDADVDNLRSILWQRDSEDYVSKIDFSRGVWEILSGLVIFNPAIRRWHGKQYVLGPRALKLQKPDGTGTLGPLNREPLSYRLMHFGEMNFFAAGREGLLAHLRQGHCLGGVDILG